MNAMSSLWALGGTRINHQTLTKEFSLELIAFLNGNYIIKSQAGF